jgi:sulfur-carrier protein
VAEQSVDGVVGAATDVESLTIGVTVRYFAAARAAAGVSEERLLVQGDVRPTDVSAQGVSAPPPVNDRGIRVARTTVGDLLDVAADRHGTGLARVLARCSFLLDEVAVHGRQTPVRDGQVLDILPPFAGG